MLLETKVDGSWNAAVGVFVGAHYVFTKFGLLAHSSDETSQVCILAWKMALSPHAYKMCIDFVQEVWAEFTSDLCSESVSDTVYLGDWA